MKLNLKDYTVRNASGSIDIQASVSKFKDDLAAYCKETDERFAKAAKAVNAVFDEFPGATINVDAVVTHAINRLKTPVTPDQFSLWAESIKDYVHANAGEGGLFEVNRGKGGGVRRVADKRAKAA